MMKKISYSIGSIILTAGLLHPMLSVAGNSSEPRKFNGGMNKEYFADVYMNADAKKNIANELCSPESFLMQCTGPVTRATDPKDNGKKLDAADCKNFFISQMDLALQHKDSTVGGFYNHLPVNVGDQQAPVFKQQLVKNIHGTVVKALADQGATVNQEQSCLMRFMNSLQKI